MTRDRGAIRGWAVLGGGLVLLAGAVAWRSEHRAASFALPGRLPVDRVVAELAAVLPDSSGVRQAPLAPRRGLLASAGPRDALIAPPGSRLPLRLRVPPEAVLAFSVGVEGDGAKDRRAAGVRFRILVDGVERFARVVNPAARRADRVWFDEQVDLSGEAGREVEIVFATDVPGSGTPGGTPGWSGVRVVERHWRARQPADPSTPNVLVLLVDTLRADRLGCYGGVPSPSPTLDALAARGALFEQNVAHAPWTMPSTASILTGLYPPAHGVTGDRGQTLRDDLLSLAEAAEEHGITTVAVSTNPLVSRGTNFAQGFETFVELDIETRREGGEVVKTPTSAAAVNDVFLRWLRSNRAHRFLAYLHYMEPHHPYTPPPHLRPPAPPGIRRRVAAGRLDPWQAAMRAPVPFQLPAPELEHVRRLYDAEIRAWDEQLAVLLRGLDARSTVIVVTADHGEAFQEHGRLQHGFHLYDELLRVPLVIAGPGIPVRRVGVQTMGVDVFPTVAALLGMPVAADLPGRDVLVVDTDRPAFSMTLGGRLPDGRGGEIVSVRTPGTKLIWASTLGHYQLFDLVRDPGEREDRWGDGAAAPALAHLLAEWRAAAPAPASAPAAPGFEERLRALGYVD